MEKWTFPLIVLGIIIIGSAVLIIIDPNRSSFDPLESPRMNGEIMTGETLVRNPGGIKVSLLYPATVVKREPIDPDGDMFVYKIKTEHGTGPVELYGITPGNTILWEGTKVYYMRKEIRSSLGGWQPLHILYSPETAKYLTESSKAAWEFYRE